MLDFLMSKGKGSKEMKWNEMKEQKMTLKWQMNDEWDIIRQMEMGKAKSFKISLVI